MFYKYYGLNKLINILINEKPDLILLTFPTPVMSVLTEQFNINIPVATVMTDYRMHKNWITPESDRYYVATKDTKKILSKQAYQPHKLKSREFQFQTNSKNILTKELG